MLTLNFYSKSLFFLMMNLGILLSISSSDPLMMWIGLEINLLSFLPIMLESNSNISASNLMKYFLVQTITSFIILFSSVNFSDLNANFDNTLIFLSLLIKLGLPPYHFWLPSVMQALNWDNAFILSSVQKVGPLALLISTASFSKVSMLMVVMSILVSALGGLAQSNFRPLMAYSSMHHMSWCIIALFMSLPLMILYFIVYATSILVIFKTFKTESMNNLSSMFKMNFSFSKTLVTILILSLAGLPPLLGFFPKLLVLNNMISISTLLPLMFLSGAAVNLFFYLNFSFSLLTLHQKSKKSKAMSPISMSLMGVGLIILPLVVFLYAMIMLYKS